MTKGKSLESIPINSLFGGGEDFQRDFDMLVEEVIHLRNYCTQALLESLRSGTPLNDWQTSKQNELQKAEALIKEIKGELLSCANKGAKFEPKRKKGAIAESQIYINKLASDHPNLTAKELMHLADKSEIGDMPLSTFKNKVSIARNPKG